jgi:hypothetical protein
MGGLNEKTVSGLRIHINDDNIHFHDDTKCLKFYSDLEIFKINIEEAFKALDKRDGMVEIPGKEDTLCIMRRRDTFSLFIIDNNDIKEELLTYLKG